MNKTATKRLFLLVIFALFTFTRVFAQAITVGTVDPGPFGQGSTISVPITIDDASVCIDQSNTFNLYLSDASGNFSPGTIIGSYTGFYTPFINGLIPPSTPAGTGYKVMVKATAPSVSSSISASFTVNAVPGVNASGAVTSTDVLALPNILGTCNGTPNHSFNISNPVPGTTVSASFFNEQTHTPDVQNMSIPAGGSNTFHALTTTNYSMIVKSVNASGTVGTYGYEIINNLIRSNIGNTGNGVVCLVNDKGDLTFNIDISSPNGGLQVNYPGDTYVFDWGDGSKTTFTFCQLKALGGTVTHTFILPSCGGSQTGANANSFIVSNQPQSPYCSTNISAPSVSAKVLKPAVTAFDMPLVACAGTAISIPNKSHPGPDITATTSTCDDNPNALYDWTFNGVTYPGYHLGEPFIIPANTPAGVYHLTLHQEVGPNDHCPSDDVTHDICLENKPQPSFTVPSPVCVSGGAVILNNTTVANPSQCSAPQYNWTVSPSTFTYTSGDATSFSPQISFTAPGIYTVQLAMPTAGCGTITAPSQTIIVDGPPTATLSPDVSICGNNMTLTFDASAGITKTTFTGTTQAQPTTYMWTVTSSSGGTFHFAGGTTANSPYPKILFDSYGTYTIQVTNTNSCGTATATQKITFVQPPVANAGVDQTVCASSPLVSLTGVITGGTATSTQWSGGNGVFSASSSLTTTYMPTNAEVAAGQVTLTLQANTAAPCTAVTDNITINFTPTANVTSLPTAAACSGQPLGYTITADNPAATFTWTAVVTTGTPTGFTTPGSGNSINDVITNTGNTDAVVTYTIIPTIGLCPGNPFILTVTVHPLPVITAVPASSPNCNSQPAGIVLTSNVSNTSYTWTSTAAAGVSGNTNQATPIVTNSIQDILVNSGTLPANVTYTITPYNGSCPGTPVTATVVIEPSPKQSIPGPDEEVCGVNTYTLQGNDPSPGTGKWTVIQGPPGAVFDDDTNPNTLVSGLIARNIYQFQWTISSSPACPTSSNVVNITIDKAPVGGTTSSPATVCSGDNNGQITLAGQFGTIVRWESSIDNGASWQPIVNGGGTQTYLNLTQTTQYRAVLKNGVCSEVPSTATTITVDPPPVVSVPGPNEEVCSVTTYTLQGNNPSPGTGKWTVVSGPAGAIFSDDTNPNAIVSGLLPGNVYQFRWTITGSAFCPPSSAIVNITIDKAPVGGTTSANPATVCSGDNSGQVTLSGQFGTIVRWESSIDGTTWEPITNTSTTQPFSNLTQTTQYRAILHNGSICSDVPSAPATVSVEPPPVASAPGPNEEVCSVTTYTLKGNNPSPGTGKWTVVSGPAGAIFSDDTNPNAIVSGLLPGNVYQFRWTITGSAFCPPSSAIVNIIIDKAPVGGIASANPTTVCAGDNTGQVTLTGQFGTIVRWESSVNGTIWTSIVNTSNVQTFSNLTQTTQYRAILHNGSICSDVPSAPATVTVEPPPIASKPGPDDEVCSVTTYTLKGNSPLPGTGKWTVVSGPAGAIFSDDTNPNAVVSGLLPGNVYQFRWTITGSASCPPSSAVVSITIDKAPVGGTTSSPATVCSGDNNGQITLSGQFGTIVRWESSIDGTTWQPIANLTATQTYSNLTQTMQYRAVLHNSNICNDVPSTPTIITVNQPAVASIPGPNEEICSITSYTLQGNNPSPGTGKWTVVQGPAGATFSDDTNPNAVVSGLIPGSVYQFRWTITASAACPPSSAVVNITIDKAPIGGTTSSPATVCSGGNNGQITLTGQFGAVVRWESSTDNGTSWQPISNTTTVQSYSNLTQTTQYRAIVKNTGVCPEAPSSATIITVNPVTVIADAGQGYNICNETAITLNGNDPSPFTGMWTQTSGKPVTIVDPSNHQTRVTGLSSGNIYTFTWTIKGLPPCGDTFSSITIAAYADVVPSFTQNQTHGCGPVSVTFTNTSTPAPTGTFLWNFGDGTPSVTAVDPPTHTFAPSTDGTEITYTITLTPTSNCNSQTPYIGHVKVSPLVPVAKLLPSQTSACGAFTLTAKNLSPGNNVSYDFYLKDAKGNIIQHITRTDKSDAVFQTLNATTPTFYTVYVVATDQCGNKGTSTPEIISVAPSSLISQIQIKGDVQSVCLGSPVTFQNISTGGDRFTVTIYNEDQEPILTIPAGVGDMNYTPTAAGLYYVSITAGNIGCGDAPVSALKQFMVYPDPQPGFTYTADNNYNVVFNNTTPGEGNIPASSLIYKWDFGDGSANETSYLPATHHFDFSKSPFKVTLTATTPGSNCLAVVTQIIDVKFAGNLFIPNAFVPASSNSQLNKFYAKGSGMKKWHMQIFNNFGQLVWETTKLDENGAPVEGWDGTYKGAIVEQGVYIWQISATLLNGEEWKGMSYNNSSPSRTGAIHLIR